MRGLLLVEDDPALRQMLTWGFSDLGYAVEAVASCREALQCAAAIRFDFALLDCGLPDGCGPALLERLRHLQPGIVAIMMSGTPDRYTGDRLRDVQVDRVLSKPVSVQKLHELFTNGRLAT